MNNSIFLLDCFLNELLFPHSLTFNEFYKINPTFLLSVTTMLIIFGMICFEYFQSKSSLIYFSCCQVWQHIIFKLLFDNIFKIPSYFIWIIHYEFQWKQFHYFMWPAAHLFPSSINLLFRYYLAIFILCFQFICSRLNFSLISVKIVFTKNKIPKGDIFRELAYSLSGYCIF